MNKNFVLATSATCGPCHTLKARLEKMGLTVENKSYNDPENIEWFKEHGIRNVPCLIVETDTTVEIVQGIENIIERIKKDK